MRNLSKILALFVVLCVALSVGALAAEPTWKDYQDYLVEAAGGNAPDLAEFQGQVEAVGSWDAIPLDESPWDMLFSTLGISTWDEFVAAGGVGAQSSEVGSEADASGEPSGEGSSEEPSGEIDVEAAYVEYIREWLQNELEHNDQMTQEQIDNEYMPLIEAGDYESFPVSYLYDGWLETGVAMTFEEFAAQYQSASGEPSAEPSSEMDGGAMNLPDGSMPPDPPADLAPGEEPPGGFGGID